MQFIKKIIHAMYYSIIVVGFLLVGSITFNGFRDIYKDFSNQERQLNELFLNDSFILKEVYRYTEKPSYFYLSSVTVIVANLEDGSGGTGIIVNKRNGYYYILTNKHVCDRGSIGSCSVSSIAEVEYFPLEFVKQAEGNIDLSLWRTNYLSEDNKVVNGFSEIYPQEKVYSVGHYLGNLYTYTEGTMAGYDDVNYLFNLSCAFGCSGSGVFDSNGNVVSLISSLPGYRLPGSPLVSADTGKVIAIPYEVMRLFLDQVFN